MFLAVLYTSCEKGADLIDVNNTVYIPQSGYSSQAVLLGESTYNLGVYKAGHMKKDEAVKVVFTVDAAALDAFKAADPKNADYVILPENYYSLPSEGVTVGKDEEKGFLGIRFKNIGADFKDTKYILPLKIQSVSGKAVINENKSVALLHISRFRNAYEGKYKAYGWTVAAGESSKSKIDVEKMLVSSDATSVITGIATEAEIKMKLTVDGTNVIITSAPGSEAYKIKNTSESSSYQGVFDEGYQRDKGVFKLKYSYEQDGKTYSAEEEVKFWL